jgi:hypothetical protein
MSTTEDTVLTPEIVAEILKIARGEGADNRRSITLMLELTRAKADLFILLRDDGIAKWWSGVIDVARKRIARRRTAWTNYRIKSAAWERLDATDRKALGVRKPTKPTSEDPDTVQSDFLPEPQTTVTE